jgi:hypothetical protein
MKKILAVAIVALALTSCKKSSTPGIGTNGIQATIAGNSSTYNILTNSRLSLYYYSATDSVFTLRIQAEDNTNGKLAHEFRMNLSTNKPFAAGEVFTDTSRGHDYTDPATLFTSFNMTSEAWFDPYNTFIEYYTAPNVNNPATLTITTVTSTAVSGTFQGPIYIDGDTTELGEAVTNGKFTATYVKEY